LPPSEAATCVKAFKPKIVYPYHYRGSNLDEFKTALGVRWMLSSVGMSQTIRFSQRLPG
jgi:hypothetical protein